MDVIKKDLIPIEGFFIDTFKIKVLPYENLKDLFKNENQYLNYLKKVVYFTKAVIEPLQNKGMTQKDSIVDVASGDGQMSLALALLGYRDLTLFDLDQDRLEKGSKIIALFCEGYKVKTIHDSAVNLNDQFDVLISYQTIEHLSDEGNYSVAKKSCQIQFLKAINEHINKLCYFNAPNNTFPVDGHDTGKWFFHWKSMEKKKRLIFEEGVKCSWAGICQPVSIGFLNKHLSRFKLNSSYYAFDSMVEYLNNKPPFDYMGQPTYSSPSGNLSFKKKIFNVVSKILGKQTQKLLPVLSVIYTKKS